MQADGNFTYVAVPGSAYSEMFTVTLMNGPESAQVNIFVEVNLPANPVRNLGRNDGLYGWGGQQNPQGQANNSNEVSTGNMPAGASNLAVYVLQIGTVVSNGGSTNVGASILLAYARTAPPTLSTSDPNAMARLAQGQEQLQHRLKQIEVESLARQLANEARVEAESATEMKATREKWAADAREREAAHAASAAARLNQNIATVVAEGRYLVGILAGLANYSLARVESKAQMRSDLARIEKEYQVWFEKHQATLASLEQWEIDRKKREYSYEFRMLSYRGLESEEITRLYFTGMGEGGVIVADEFTFNRIPPLHEEADRLVEEGGDAYRFSRASARIGSEAAYTAAGLKFFRALGASQRVGTYLEAHNNVAQGLKLVQVVFTVKQGKTIVIGISNTYDAYEAGDWIGVYEGVGTTSIGSIGFASSTRDSLVTIRGWGLAGHQQLLGMARGSEGTLLSFGAVPPRRNLPLRVGPYGQSAAQSVGDGHTPDHLPSFAAIRAAVERAIGRPLTAAEARALRNETNTILIPTQSHIESSRTFGGRNTQQQIQTDSRDLQAAFRADRATLRQRLIDDGYTVEEINAAFRRLDNLNRQSGRY
jgi:hypothetical protein